MSSDKIYSDKETELKRLDLERYEFDKTMKFVEEKWNNAVYIHYTYCVVVILILLIFVYALKFIFLPYKNYKKEHLDPYPQIGLLTNDIYRSDAAFDKSRKL